MTKLILDLETSGLNPMTNRITCISILDPDTLGSTIPTSFYGLEEKTLLEQFWKAVEPYNEFVGYNSSEFDIPFLIKRSLINNVKIKKGIKSLDLRKVVNGFWFSYQKAVPGTLLDWAVILGFPVKTENGEAMVKAYEERNWEKIKSHCEEDCLITKALLLRCIVCGVI